ncbi:RHS repeat-associated core domain-containing protein [Pseudomonas promysalinigenes]|uniref:RHS repeat-associated core domain-containing protein n=1 Tax=Pseudomonas promysalinigenes TaxID=485898 RepID=A0ABY6AIP6_9PSED|nr:RHS repeat-associated core domain-containing protein [Pseudomonas promysalinigenes]UXH38579.1 RHS repeat-associated core domain-containing protein [Pseudomonas promysalinigenes]
MIDKVRVGYRAYELLAYSVYGYIDSGARSGLLGYNGQLLDPRLQGYALGNGHRLYRPELMRFLSPDTISPFGAGGVNAYAYCTGDPVNLQDPSGRFGLDTGLTKGLKKIGLPKSELKKYLKPLAKSKNRGHKRWVYRLKDDHFERFEFIGTGSKIAVKQLENLSYVFTSFTPRDFYRYKDLYVPQPTVPPSAIKALTDKGFTLMRLDIDALVHEVWRGPPSVTNVGAGPSTAGSNYYSADPVSGMKNIRNGQ